MSELDAFRLEDQVAIVTGAGIGRAIAELFGQTGAKVVVSDLKKETTQGIAGSIHEAGGADFAAACDVTEIADRMHLVEKAAAKAQFKVSSPFKQTMQSLHSGIQNSYFLHIESANPS